MKAMIFDMDGTLADVRSIAHHFSEGSIDTWDLDTYHLESVGVPVVDWVAEAAQQAHKDGYHVLIVTARKTKYMDYTERFISSNDIWCDMLFMRSDDDDRSDYDLKKDILRRIRNLGYSVERAYDDKPEIIALWESEGIETVHVRGYGFDYAKEELMSKTYFATDGSYGDAKSLIVLDTTDWDDEVWRKIEQMTNSERYDFADEKHFELVNKDMLESGA